MNYSHNLFIQKMIANGFKDKLEYDVSTYFNQESEINSKGNGLK